MTSVATERRLQVLDLRTRIERLAAAAFDEVCLPGQTGHQSQPAQRLLYLVGIVGPVEQDKVYRLVRLGGYVYRRTSDVLHGRLSSMDLGDVVIDEWRIVVADMEQGIRRATACASRI